MQMHPDYIEGHHVKATYLKRDAEDNKLDDSESKAYLDCKVQLHLKHDYGFKK